MIVVLVGTVLVLTAALSWILHDIRFPSAAEVTSRSVIALKSADGQDLFHEGHARLPPVEAKEMPVDVVNAVLSIEDRRFFQHDGVDLRSVLRALEQNIRSGKTVAGGSTITQQLVKILFLSPERTYKRKIEEAAISIWIEHRLTKNEILTSYLNNVYLGSGATGFPAAAELYFGKKVADLSLPEAAMLAGMINAPGQDDPFHDLDAARRRAAIVLDAMVDNGKVTEEAALVAKLHPARPSPAEISPPSTGWFVDWVYNRAAAVTPALGGTVRIRTTLDLRLQQLASSILKSTLAKYGSEKHAGQAALVAMRPDGAVVAMVGGKATIAASTIARSRPSGSLARPSSCSTIMQTCARVSPLRMKFSMRRSKFMAGSRRITGATTMASSPSPRRSPIRLTMLPFGCYRRSASAR